MRIELGKRADYAVRAVVHLTHHDAGATRRKAREIAVEMGIPQTFVAQILADLVRAEIVTSVAGPNGGYTLARDPADISLLEVIVAADGEPVSTECVLRGGPCRWDGVCAVHEPWSRAKDSLRAELARTSLREIGEIGEIDELLIEEEDDRTVDEEVAQRAVAHPHGPNDYSAT